MWMYVAPVVGLCFLFRWYRRRQIVPNLSDKYVFITGCDSGFGNQLAKQLDLKGLRVLAACFTEAGAEQLKEAASERLQTVILDVRDSSSVSAAACWVKRHVGEQGLWGLVNNAGVDNPVGPNEWLTKEDFMKVINVNLVGVIDVTLSLLPLLRKARGRIVNVSSVFGRVVNFGGGYSIAKFGLEAFSDSLRRDLLPLGVKVAIVEPGVFRTALASEDRMRAHLQDLWDSVPLDVKESYGRKCFDKLYQNLHRLVQKSNPKLTLATNCMEHGLTAVHPRTRYSAGWDAKLFYIPVSYLPTSLADYLLK